MKRTIGFVLSLHDEPFFREMSEHVVSRLQDYVYHREYEFRQIIYFPDDSCDYVYWVRSGRVKVTRVSGDGRELTFRHLFPGDILGEEALVKDSHRGAYAEAMESTVLCLLRADDFRRLAAEEGEISLMVAKSLCRRVIETEQVLSETVFNSVRCRVASGLLRLYQRAPNEEDGTLRVTHQDIANLVGSTRETTTGVLHSLRKQGILEMANRRVRVLDPAALQRVTRNAQ